MFTKPTPPLYTVKGYKGAHYLRDLRESGEIATVHLVGADLPFDVDRRDVVPFTQADAITEGNIYLMLAQEAAVLFGQDPARINRAVEIVRTSHAVQNANRDESGQEIQPSLNCLCVKGSSGWYVVRPGSCTCEDSKRGHTCKHRIAAWMHRESIIRPLAQARRVAPAVILAELTTTAHTAQTAQDW